MSGLDRTGTKEMVRTDLGLPYVGSNWDPVSAMEIMNAWASRLRKAIDAAHKP